MSLMSFKSIEVENFRQFKEKVLLENLDAGLNIIAGSNEAGKSTLLQAVRAALFDRHGSAVGKSYKPYKAEVSPRVALVFTVDGVEYKLNKVFSSKKDGKTELKASDGKSWEGQAAEEHLAELLGFSYAKKGGSKTENQGLAGLLWVEQAKAYEKVMLSEHSHDRIQSVFENEMRDMLGGDQGEKLHRRITDLRDEYFAKNGAPRGEYKKLAERVEDLNQQLEKKEEELKAFKDKVDLLESWQKELGHYRKDNALDKAKARLEKYRQLMGSITRLQSQIQTGETLLKTAEAEYRTAALIWKNREDLIERLKTAQLEIARLDKTETAKEKELAPGNKSLEKLQTEHVELKRQRDKLETAVRRAREIEVLDQLTEKAGKLASDLIKAKEADVQRRQCLSSRDAIKVTDDLLQQLRDIERARDLAEERLKTVATHIKHKLKPGVNVRLQGQMLTDEGELQLTQTAELEIDGIGSITIIPGGEELPALQRKLDENDQSLKQLLQDVGADSIASAEKNLQDRQTLKSQVAQYKATISALAPDGLSDLEDSNDSVVSRRDKLQEALGEILPEEKRTGDLETEAEKLSAQIHAMEVTLEMEEKTVGQLSASLTEVRADIKTAEREMQSLTVELEQARGEASDETLKNGLAETEKKQNKARQDLNTSRLALEKENPEAAESELERAQRAVTDISQEIETLERKTAELKVELNALGQSGLAEEVATLKTEYTAERLKYEQTDRRAKALDLLQRTLDEALQQAREAVARPIIDKLTPYLRQLIPNAEPLVDENLVLTGIQRDNTTESFNDLSIGTREQLAVLIRLAYADLLTEKGVPVMVILDDALVNSDDDRRDRMKAIIYQAAKRYQILLLTCHGREYRDIGGRYIRLDEAISRS